LLAFNLPVTAPWWIPVIGGMFAMIVVKQLFGGLGQNFMNPALAARVFLMMSWTSIMTNWAVPVSDWGKKLTMADAVTSATPLMTLKSGAQPDVSILELLLGSRGGCLGETSALLLIAGGIYLMVRKVILPHTPLAFIGTVAILTYLFPQGGMDNMNYMLTEILSGGLMLGAIFMATDYSTTPVTKNGKIIFGIGCGLLTVLIRYFGGYPEGVSFSIILMNIMTGFIDQWTKPRIFGGGAKLGKAKRTN
jgi:electron transport complex protein RnfD